jgi:hypothetical protein
MIALFSIYQAYQKLKKAVRVELLSIASLGQKRYVLWLASQNMKKEEAPLDLVQSLNPILC